MAAALPPKILIIEDEKSLRDILRDKVNHEGLTAITAEDGEAGLTLALKSKPDLILLDVIMPRLNGLKVLSRLRSDSWGKTVPVILLSNDDNPEHISQTLKDDATDYLIKADWKLEEVIKKIKGTLKLL